VPKTKIVFVQGNRSSERNDKIRSLRTQGRTLEEIGEQHGITRERVRQICECLQEQESGTLVLPSKFERLLTLLQVKCTDDFGKITYSRILSQKYTSVRMIQELEQFLQEHALSLVADVDLESFSKKYTRVQSRKKPGPKTGKR